MSNCKHNFTPCQDKDGYRCVHCEVFVAGDVIGAFSETMRAPIVLAEKNQDLDVPAGFVVVRYSGTVPTVIR